jgi:hypothetical protein
MFGDDEPRNPSPRTTIVGGQPPQAAPGLPPVPTGLQRLLRLAAVDPAFARELAARRAAVAAAAGVELTPSERAILAAIPAAQLEAMIAGLPPPEEDRRSFLRQTAASAVVLLGGAVLGPACPVKGSRPDVPPEPPPPPRPDEPAPVPAGVRPDVPPPPPPPEPPPRPEVPTAPPAGARPDVPPPPRPENREMLKTGGANPDRPRPRRVPVPAGIRPRPDPDAVPRPERSRPTRGAIAIEPFGAKPTRGGKVEPFDDKK